MPKSAQLWTKMRATDDCNNHREQRNGRVCYQFHVLVTLPTFPPNSGVTSIFHLPVAIVRHLIAPNYTANGVFACCSWSGNNYRPRRPGLITTVLTRRLTEKYWYATLCNEPWIIKEWAAWGIRNAFILICLATGNKYVPNGQDLLFCVLKHETFQSPVNRPLPQWHVVQLHKHRRITQTLRIIINAESITSRVNTPFKKRTRQLHLDWAE